MPGRIAGICTATVICATLTIVGGDSRRPAALYGLSPPPAFSLAARNQPYLTGLELDVYTPAMPLVDLPVAVLVHGCCGDRTDLVKLAETVAARGAVVMNVDWGRDPADWLVGDGLDAVACAVRFARSEASSYGGDPRRLVLVGWSDGAMLAATVALGPERPPRPDCRSSVGSGRPDAVVGLAGFYGWELPVDPVYATEAAVRFVGGDPALAPELWHDATPYAWLNGPVESPVTVVVGVDDPLRPDGERFAAAVEVAGGSARLVLVPAAGEPTLLSPRTAEGQTAAAAIIDAA